MYRYFDIRGLRFCIRRWGTESEPILFLHGVHGTSASWDGVVQALNGVRPAIGMDLRGHGGSSWPDDGYDVRTIADDVAAVVQEMSPPYDIVGHGFGAAAALVVAAIHPTVVRRLLMSELPIDDRETGPVTRIIRETPESFGSFEEGRQFLAERMVGVSAETIDRRASERLRRDLDGRWRWRGSISGMRALIKRPMAGFNLWELAPRVLAPTVVVRGSRSIVFPVESFERLARVIPGAEGFQIANVGQALPDERPLAMAHVLRGFLGAKD